ncbi:hypothetical protein ACFS3C_07250 [Azotobacter vinelandii]|nr:hypothetical protein [Azotobacter vinelandii]WKN23499.1 hypothetical protein AVAEIV_001572 [Azotobacter vinelandii]GLK59591.1 hypothetical protein GCM10017624_17480 [Azotobacter vinelandii]SFX97541.1 hypothetical protein SAMN04244547_03457 [Azotobacter vinelandii]
MSDDPAGRRDDNPYAPPREALLASPGVPPMPDWSPAQLWVLGWLALAMVLGTLVIMLLSFGGFTRMRGVALYANWLGLALVLLGNYLLLRLKGFVEARFAARGLGWPVWLCVVLGLLLEVVALRFEPGPLADWLAWLYAVALVGYGGLLVWLGARLLGVPEAFRALYGMGWLVIAGGLMLASLVLATQAALPLMGAYAVLARVFFRGAAELRGRA